MPAYGLPRPEPAADPALFDAVEPLLGEVFEERTASGELVQALARFVGVRERVC